MYLKGGGGFCPNSLCLCPIWAPESSLTGHGCLIDPQPGTHLNGHFRDVNGFQAGVWHSKPKERPQDGLLVGGVPTTPDPNTSGKVSRHKWEPYRDINWWCIYY